MVLLIDGDVAIGLAPIMLPYYAIGLVAMYNNRLFLRQKTFGAVVARFTAHQVLILVEGPKYFEQCRLPTGPLYIH